MTVDSSQAMSEQQRYLRAATEDFNILRQQAAEESRTLQEQIRFMEQKIALMRDNARLNREQELATIEGKYAAGRISGTTRQQLRIDTRQATREELS